MPESAKVQVASVLLTAEGKKEIEERGHNLVVRKQVCEQLPTGVQALPRVWGMEKSG